MYPTKVYKHESLICFLYIAVVFHCIFAVEMMVYVTSMFCVAGVSDVLSKRNLSETDGADPLVLVS